MKVRKVKSNPLLKEFLSSNGIRHSEVNGKIKFHDNGKPFTLGKKFGKFIVKKAVAAS